MATGSVHGIDYNDVSFIATAAMATLYVPVKNDTAVNTVVVATAVGDEVTGFLQQTQATAGGAVPVRTSGFSLAVAGTAGWTRGDKLTADTAGVLITTTTAGDKVCAIAEDTAAVTEIGEIRIIYPAVRYDSF